MADAVRFPEIDLLRGVAILMMVIYHTLFDLWYFAIVPVVVTTGFWKAFALATASLFLLIVGVSFSISYARASVRLSGFRLYLRFLTRGFGIFALGLLVTLGTWLYLGEGFIIFGILHLIGISLILAPFFYRFGKWTIAIGLAVIATGLFVVNGMGPFYMLPFGVQPEAFWSVDYSPVFPWTLVNAISPLLQLPLGLHTVSFWSVDYTPLLPWFGVVLIGLGIGSVLYPGGIARGCTLPEIPATWERVLTFPGRNSLLIYLVHQPVIILILHFATGAVPL